MRNIKLTLEYDGTNYYGWQVQNGPRYPSRQAPQKTIQAAIEKILAQILQERVKLTGSGRTDAGVHAFAQTANFMTGSVIALDKLKDSLNSILPDDIAVAEVKEEKGSFHARFQAKSKIYRYVILNRPYPSPLLKNRAYFCRYPLDLKMMRKEAGYLLGRHDFKAFSASASRVKDTVRTVKKIKISKDTASSLVFIDIEADGFLYNMVRNIMGTLVDIGRGKPAFPGIKKILLSKDRRLAGPTLPACGLFLVKVNY